MSQDREREACQSVSVANLITIIIILVQLLLRAVKGTLSLSISYSYFLLFRLVGIPHVRLDL